MDEREFMIMCGLRPRLPEFTERLVRADTPVHILRLLQDMYKRGRCAYSFGVDRTLLARLVYDRLTAPGWPAPSVVSMGLLNAMLSERDLVVVKTRLEAPQLTVGESCVLYVAVCGILCTRYKHEAIGVELKRSLAALEALCWREHLHK